jgi:uncharacterized protein YceK
LRFSTVTVITTDGCQSVLSDRSPTFRKYLLISNGCLNFLHTCSFIGLHLGSECGGKIFFRNADEILLDISTLLNDESKYNIVYPKTESIELSLISSTSGCRSVGIVRSRTKGHGVNRIEFRSVQFFFSYLWGWSETKSLLLKPLIGLIYQP